MSSETRVFFVGNTFDSLHLKNSLLSDRVPFGGASKSEVNAPSLRRAFVLLLSGWSNEWFLEENGMMIKHVMLQSTSVVWVENLKMPYEMLFCIDLSS